MSKRIVIWCGDAPNQRALANRIAAQFPLAGIVIEQRKNTAKRNFRSLPGKIWDRFRFASLYGAWKGMLAGYDNAYPNWPDTKVIRVPLINSPEAEAFTRSLSPDLVVVSGTGLIREPLLSLPASIGIINLHTGLSPYVKGGPNCTWWCIANNEWHLVGNTIMWINAGIDSGHIITTETIDIRNAKDLQQAQQWVMDHAHDLYIRAIGYLLNGNSPYTAVDQADFKAGKTFYTKMWTAQKRAAALQNWTKRKTATITEKPRTIPLPQ